MTVIILDVKTTFRNLVRDQSVSICMLQTQQEATKVGDMEVILLPSARRPGMAICNVYSKYNKTGSG
jgi:hypothetical protein